MTSEIDQTPHSVAQATHRSRKSELGQFFTSGVIARFMAEMFSPTTTERIRLLDAGAGSGFLSAAFLDRWASDGFPGPSIEVDAFELDESLIPQLQHTFSKYQQFSNVTASIHQEDFIHAAVESLVGGLFSESLPKYTHSILNPPYKKIRSDSAYRLALRQAGIETVNLYSAFVALSLMLLEEGGQLVAIIPRSFCNGPYYHPFRSQLLRLAAIKHIHLFESRDQAFKQDDVLQENIILLLKRGGTQGEVTISTSTDDTFHDLRSHPYPFDRIVNSTDHHQFIQIPNTLTPGLLESSTSIRHDLDEVEVNVSTGPVVDFRLKEHLLDEPTSDSVPLLYPVHLSEQRTNWPKVDSKKPNSIRLNESTQKWLYPNEFYCVVRRFSSKEEKRRVVARVVRPDAFRGFDWLGFENHLNVYHDRKRGLPEKIAYGLAVFLNSSAVDEDFRRFNGHTQVNATDLRRMKYPSREDLIALGEWSMNIQHPSQEQIDDMLESLI